MSYRHIHRLLAGAGLAAALIAVTAVPGSAHRASPRIDFFVGASTVAAGHPGVETGAILFSSEPVTLENATLTFDTSGLKGVATVAAGDGEDCAGQSPTRLVCTRQFGLDVDSDGIGGVFDVIVAAARGAKPGDSGKLRVTLSASGVKPVTRESRVLVAEGIDLVAGRALTARARPGADFDAPMTVRNAGTRVVNGATVMFYNDHAFEARGRFRNCTYVDGRLRSCAFTQALAPGATYRLTVPYRLRKDTAAPGTEYGESLWLTPEERADLADYQRRYGYSLGKPGTDGVLGLTRTTAAKRAPQADVSPDNNWSSIEVTALGRQGSDLSAVGDEVSGAAGATVTATVGLRNRGPATIDWNRSGENIAQVNVTVPNGSTVTSVPDGCFPVKNGEVDTDAPERVGARAYRCYSGYLLLADVDLTFRFGLRIDRVVPDATGAVTVNEPCECPQFTKDTDPGNDRAALVVNATGDDGRDDGGQGGGDLALTGPAGPAIVGAGVLLLLVGAAAVIVARRRTRFTA